jgi:hypothetical protein
MATKGKSGGGAGVRGSASVSGSFFSHLLSGLHLFQINIGGRGKRGGGIAGRIKRAATSGLKTIQEARSGGGKKAPGGAGRSAGRGAPASTGRSLPDFQAEHPEPFEGPPTYDISVDSDVDEVGLDDLDDADGGDDDE